MLQEIFTYLTERPKLKEAKSFGHLRESISLIARQRRCQKYWASHQTNCREFIKTQMSHAKNFDSILVLGSGPLHEIPIETIAKKFTRVVLVDIVHLKSTREQVAHLKNIEFVEHDITELEAFLSTQKKLINKAPTSFLEENWGIVLSVNIMSQLPLHFNEFIRIKMKNMFQQTDINLFVQKITRDHLNYLESFKCPVVLITDTQTFYLDKNDHIVQTDQNYSHLLLPKESASWTWNVAPIPEFQKDIGMQMKVDAFVLKNSNSR